VSRYKKEFLAYLSRRECGFFIFIYDREIVENKNSRFYGVKINLACDERELNDILSKCVSINFFGEKSVKKGLEKGYIHPDSIIEIDGIPCAIFIQTSR